MDIKDLNIKSLSCCLQQASSLFLFANLPFYFNNIQRWSIIAFIVFSVIDIIINQRWKDVEFKSLSSILCYLLIFQFLLILFYIPFERETGNIGTIIENRLSFLAFGLIGLFANKKSINPKYYAYVATTVTVGLTVYVLYILLKDYEFDSLRLYCSKFNDLRHTHVHAHMAVNIFFGTTMLLSAYMVGIKEKWWQKALFSLPIILSYALMTQSDGRVGLIGANIIILAIIISSLWKKRVVLYTTIALVAAFSLTTIILHPKTTDTFERSRNPRVWIWAVAKEKIMERPLTGYGPNTALEEMRSGMLNNKDFMAANDEFLIHSLKNNDEILGAHPHNQLLQSILEYGIIGLITILLTLLLPFIISVKKENTILIISFWLYLVLQLLTETIHTSVGEVAFCLYIILILQLPNKVLPDNSKVDKSLS